MRNGDWTLFGMHTECAQRRSSRRNKRSFARPAGTREPDYKKSSPSTDGEQVPDSVPKILKEARAADEAHRARLEARIAQLERELSEARAAASAVAAGGTTDLGLQDLQATLAAQQVEQQHREALDLWLVEADLRADDEARRKEQLEAPALIPTLVETPTPAAPVSKPEPVAVETAANLDDKLSSASLALEAAEARAAHNAQQVKRLTEELMAARQEQMRTAARLRDLEDRLQKAEDRAGIVTDYAEAPPEVSAKPDHSMPLPLDTVTEAVQDTTAAEPQTETLHLSSDDIEPDTLEDLGHDVTDFGTSDVGVRTGVEAVPAEEETEEQEASSAPDIDPIEEDDDIFGTPSESLTSNVETAPAGKSPVDALADVLSAWDEPSTAIVEDERSEEDDSSDSATSLEEAEAEPDIADALASWSRGELQRDALPDLDDFVMDIPSDEMSAVEEAATSPESEVSLEDALANWSAGEESDQPDPAEEIETISDDPFSDVFGESEEAKPVEASEDISSATDNDDSVFADPPVSEDNFEALETPVEQTPKESAADSSESSEEPPAPRVELVEDDEPETEDFEPEPAEPDTPIAAKARDNATRMNENLQQWSGVRGTTRREAVEQPPSMTPIAASAEEDPAPAKVPEKREQGKKAMVDALLKFMGPR